MPQIDSWVDYKVYKNNDVDHRNNQVVDHQQAVEHLFRESEVPFGSSLPRNKNQPGDAKSGNYITNNDYFELPL
jgi:hypothetical protein